MIEKIGFFSLIEKKEARLLPPLSLIKEKDQLIFLLQLQSLLRVPVPFSSNPPQSV
jgi:hypothetical protein